MGLERLRIALLRGFDIPQGPMREDALDWVKEQEDRRQRRHRIIMVATIAAAIGAWLVALILLRGRL
jgi:Tfp pilus assembly protein PilN